jgi:hypothetical protein
LGILPFADWFYHLSQKDDELNTKYNQYLTLVGTINANGVKYNHDLETLQKMMIINYSLIIISAQTKMSESDYIDFLNRTQELPPAKPTSATVITILDAVSGLLGMASLGNFFWSLGKAYGPALKNAVSSLFSKGGEAGGEAGGDIALDMFTQNGTDQATQVGVTALGDEEATAITDAATRAGVDAGTDTAIDAAETAIEEGTTASLASSAALSGAGILAAVGIDAILGAIDGAKQSSELEDAIDKLSKALAALSQFSTTLENNFTTLEEQVVRQEQAFLACMTILNGIQPATFAYGQQEATFINRVNFIVEMEQALTQYGFLTKVRNSWINYQSNQGASATWNGFTPIALAFKPPNMTVAIANEFLNYAKTKLIN